MKLISYRCQQIVQNPNGFIDITYGHSFNETLEEFLEETIDMAKHETADNPRVHSTYIVINVADVSDEFYKKWEHDFPGI